MSNDTTLWDTGDFPAAFLLPITDERPAKRWRARDVMSRATRIRATNNNRRMHDNRD